MIGIIDYGVGNLFSLRSSFSFIGADAVVTSSEKELAGCSHIILPGVGAFADAVAKLRRTGLDRAVMRETATGKPLLGICLGMQMLFEKSYEYGCHEGLGLVRGAVRPIRDVISDELKIPHIGWNKLRFTPDLPKSPIFKYIDEGDFVYFVHSYYGADCDCVTATSDYGVPLTAAVQNGNVFGTQFHPEKSGQVGLSILRAFCEI